MLERNGFKFIKEFVDENYEFCQYLSMFVFKLSTA